MGERRPNVFVEERVIDVHVVDGRFLFGGGTASGEEITADAVASEVDAIRVDGERCVEARIVGALRFVHVDEAFSRKVDQNVD